MEFNDCGMGARLRAGFLAGVCLLMAGCSFSVDQVGHGSPCRLTRECIDGLTCVQRKCVRLPEASEVDAAMDPEPEVEDAGSDG